MKRIFRNTIYLNIDVTLGALVNCLLFGKLLGVEVPTPVLGILALTVWQIYTFDRLLDVKSNNEVNSPRHDFHRRYFNLLAVVLIASFSFSAVLLFYLPLATLQWGGAVLFITLIYFLSIHLLPLRFIYHKELTIAAVYSVGIIIGPLSLAGQVGWEVVPLIVAFFLLAFLNLLIFSFHDSQFDRSSRFPSLINRLGRQKSAQFIDAVVAGLYLLLLFYGVSIPSKWMLVSIFFVMSVPLLLLFYRWNESYRWVGDLVFLFPGFLLV